MCILLKLHYAKFDVSRLFFQKLSKTETFGVSARPRWVKNLTGVKMTPSGFFGIEKRFLNEILAIPRL